MDNRDNGGDNRGRGADGGSRHAEGSSRHEVSGRYAEGSSRQRRQQTGLGGTVRFRTCFHNVVYDVFRARAWKETDSDVDWDVCWADTGWIRDNFDNIRLLEHQRINHFRNHYELTRKDSMIKNLKRAQRALLREGQEEEAAKYEFSPTTYVLPVDYGLFVEEFKSHVGAFWIMKPIGGAQGKGIFLFNKLSQIADWKKDHRWKADNPQARQTRTQPQPQPRTQPRTTRRPDVFIPVCRMSVAG